MVLERPSLSIICPPKSEEKILGSKEQNAINPVHNRLPVVLKTYHGSSSCMNWLTKDEVPSAVQSSRRGVLLSARRDISSIVSPGEII